MNSRTRWLRLLPVAFITYSLAYLARANFGFAVAGEMGEDLRITPAVSSLLGSLFSLAISFSRYQAHITRPAKVRVS